MAIDDEKRRQTLSINEGLPFPRGLPPRSAVTTPMRIEQPKVPTAGQTAGAGVRAAGSAIDRATQQFSIGTLPPAGAIYRSGNRFSDQRTAGATQVQQPAQQARKTSAAQPARAPRAQVQPAAPAAANGVTRSGNRFSDQPIANGVAFQPGRGTLSVVDASGGINDPSRRPGIDKFLQGGAQARAEQRAGQQRHNAYESQRAARSETIRTAQNMLQKSVPGSKSTREVQAALLGAQATPVAPQPADDAGIAQGFAGAQQQQAVAEAQAQATQLAQQAAMRKQQLQQQLGGVAQGDPRRTAIDQLLVDQGKDPDAGRYMGIDVLGPTDSFGTPTQLRGALDTRSGSILGGGTTASPSVGGQLPEGALVQQNGKTFRIVNGQPVPVENKAR
jgi:hypothetical protein